MSKQAKARRLTGQEAMAKVCSVRTSARKLNLVAQSIRGLNVQRALNELEFSHKRIAKDVRKALYSAISNAENNHNLDIDNLVVAEAFVGKNLVMKRFHARARGNAGGIEKFFSQLTIVVEEKREEKKEEAKPAEGKTKGKAKTSAKKPAAKKASAKKPAAKKEAA